jgi:valyl-tRNA synthetase
MSWSSQAIPHADPHQKAVAKTYAQGAHGYSSLLHPFMPYILNKFDQKLPGHHETIMLDPWRVKMKPAGCASAEEMQMDMDATRALRNNGRNLISIHCPFPPWVWMEENS